MNLTFKLALVFFLLLTLSCKERHLFSDQSELATVTRDFEDKQKALPHGADPLSFIFNFHLYCSCLFFKKAIVYSTTAFV